MAVKTITVTKAAYEALKAKKLGSESFSDAILRITKRRPLSDFYGVLGKRTADRMEAAIMEMRKSRNLAHRRRMREIAKAFQGGKP